MKTLQVAISVLRSMRPRRVVSRISLQSLKVHGQSSDFEAGFQAALKVRVGAIIPIRSVELTRHINRVTELAIKNRTPSMCERIEYIEAGCLMSYATNDADQFQAGCHFR